MPRVNIEDELWTDARFLELIVKLGTPEAALGAVVRCWITAQRFWKQSSNGIPKTEWTKQKLRHEVIEVGLATDTGDFILVVGSEKHFGWIRKRIAAGQRGGLKGKGKTKSKTKQNEPSPSFSLSPSSSPSDSHSTSPNGEVKNVPPGSQSAPDGPTLNRRIWTAYEDEYRRRYHGTEPTRNASVNSQISAFGKRLGSDAPEVARFYVRHNKGYYVEKQHMVGPMLADAEALHVQWKNGRQITRTQANNTDRKQANVNVFESMLLGMPKEAT